MTLQQAVERAIKASKEEQCTCHVNGRIVGMVVNGKHVARLNTEAYYVSDWYVDGSTVFTFTDGEA